MFIYAIQTYVDTAEEWRVLTTVKADPRREHVLAVFRTYLEKYVRKSKKAKSRQYRLAKFHYGGCRHLVNPRAK